MRDDNYIHNITREINYNENIQQYSYLIHIYLK